MSLPTINREVVLGQQYKSLPNLQVPTEQMLTLPEKVLQFGTGAFLRGFADYFIDKANHAGVFNGRIVAVQSTGTGRSDILSKQDSFYTLCLKGIVKGEAVEQYYICSSLSRTLSAQEEWHKVLACAANPELTVIISNTTEVGIQLVEEDILAQPPASFPAKLTAFLYERFKIGGGPAAQGFVIVPCELIVDNGKKLKEIVIALAAYNKLDAAFVEWVEKSNSFCNALVDRIVPGMPDEATYLAEYEKLGYRDDLLTMAEVYSLWAIEGDARAKAVLTFAQTDPGVIIADDIMPYRERKLRLLNGVHTIFVGLAYLYGFNTVGEAMHDKVLNRFIYDVAHDEVVPSLPVDRQSASDFADEVLDRFRNPHIVHPLLSITLQYTSKMNLRNVPTLFNYQHVYNTPPPDMTLGFAAYLLFMKAVKQEDNKYFGQRTEEFYHINDDKAAVLYKHWTAGLELDETVKNILADTALWSRDLNELPKFAETLTGYLKQFEREGIVHVTDKVVV